MVGDIDIKRFDIPTAVYKHTFYEQPFTRIEHKSGRNTDSWWNNPLFITHMFGVIDSGQARECTNRDSILMDQWKSFFEAHYTIHYLGN